MRRLPPNPLRIPSRHLRLPAPLPAAPSTQPSQRSLSYSPRPTTPSQNRSARISRLSNTTSRASSSRASSSSHPIKSLSTRLPPPSEVSPFDEPGSSAPRSGGSETVAPVMPARGDGKPPPEVELFNRREPRVGSRLRDKDADSPKLVLRRNEWATGLRISEEDLERLWQADEAEASRSWEEPEEVEAKVEGPTTTEEAAGLDVGESAVRAKATEKEGRENEDEDAESDEEGEEAGEAESATTKAAAPRHRPPSKTKTLVLGPTRLWVNVDQAYILAHRKGYPSRHIFFGRLLDNCPCPDCVDPSTRQKRHSSGTALRRLGDALRGLTSDHFAVVVDRASGEQVLRVRWPSGKEGATGAHESHYPLAVLQGIAWGGPGPTNLAWKLVGSERWPYGEAQLQQTVNRPLDLADLTDPATGTVSTQGMHELLRRLISLGLVIVRGVPTSPTDNRACELRKFIEQIGPLRNSFYGETWDVKNMVNSKNVAYTDVPLGLHMDLLYFKDPPRFQALHCLRSRVDGGKSYFVDSFAVADRLEECHPKSYTTLASRPIFFEYDNDGHYLSHHHRIFERRADGRYMNVNWSPPFQGPMRHLSSVEAVNTIKEERWYYRALDRWERLLNRPERRFEYQMQEGDLVLFDNRRILHAREGFRDWSEAERKERGVEIKEGEPSRWLKGCYIDGDAVWDRFVVLEQGMRAALKKNM